MSGKTQPVLSDELVAQKSCRVFEVKSVGPNNDSALNTFLYFLFLRKTGDPTGRTSGPTNRPVLRADESETNVLLSVLAVSLTFVFSEVRERLRTGEPGPESPQRGQIGSAELMTEPNTVHPCLQ